MNGFVQLSRFDGEKIFLRLPSGETITIVVRGHGKIKVAIQAPKSVLIAREEVADLIFGYEWSEEQALNSGGDMPKGASR